MRIAATGAALIAIVACGGGEPRDGTTAERDAGVALDTILLAAPDPIVDAPVTIDFEATREATFECSLDAAPWAPCAPPVDLGGWGLGLHLFEARSVDGEETDPTPVRATFTRVQHARTPNVAVVEAAEGWFAAGDGGVELADVLWPEQLRPFYEAYPDDYMAVSCWTDFPTRSSVGAPFALPLQHDVGGIGAEWYFRLPPGSDRSAAAGSDGALEVAIFMQDVGYWAAAAWPDAFWDGKVLDVLAQEFGHRWLSYVRLPDADAQGDLLDDWGAHWDFHVGLDAPSPMGCWAHPVDDHGDGTFTAHAWAGPTRYAAIDLYAMGLLAPEDVPDFFYVKDAAPSIPRDFGQRGAWDFSGVRTDVAIDDVVRALGPRDPPVGEAPIRFRQAFVLFVEPGSAPDPESLAFVDGVRRDWEVFFGEATRGLGTVDTALFETTRAEQEVEP